MSKLLSEGIPSRNHEDNDPMIDRKWAKEAERESESFGRDQSRFIQDAIRAASRMGKGNEMRARYNAMRKAMREGTY